MMTKPQIRLEPVDSQQILALCRNSMRCTSSLLAGLSRDPFNTEQLQVLKDLGQLAANAHQVLEQLLNELREAPGSGTRHPVKR